MALAEPDYSARIDYPEELARVGERQTRALCQQGASPDAGRRMASVFSDAGLEITEVCIIGSQWSSDGDKEAQIREWSTLREDLNNMYSEEEWRELQAKDVRMRNTGARVLFVPTFSVLAKKYKQ